MEHPVNREAYTSMSKLVANYALRHDSLGLQWLKSGLYCRNEVIMPIAIVGKYAMSTGEAGPAAGR